MHCILQGVLIIDPTSPFHNTKKDISIRDGKIDEIADHISDAKDAELFAVAGACVSPGWCDMLAAFFDPGHEEKETIESGIDAALAGGFTTVCLMPMADPAIHRKTDIEYILNKAKHKPVRILPYGSVTMNREGVDLTEMYDMREAGAVAFTDADKPIRDAGVLLRSLQYVRPFDGVIIDIPNDHRIMGNANVNEGEMSVHLGMYGIPDVLEELSVIRDIKLAEYANARIHLGIISSAKSIAHIRTAKEAGVRVTAGTSAYHLYFDESELFDYNTHFKVNPPLRSREDVLALVEAVKDGTIDVVCSYHIPHEADAKDVEFENASFGMETLESTFGAAHFALDGNTALLIEKIAINPRKILGLEIPGVQLGAEAELTIFIPDAEWECSAENIRSRSKNAGFIGRELLGKAIATFTFGKLNIL
ncbi:MAG: dihydroorotase [Chitinophagales bacterium]